MSKGPSHNDHMLCAMIGVIYNESGRLPTRQTNVDEWEFMNAPRNRELIRQSYSTNHPVRYLLENSATWKNYSSSDQVEKSMAMLRDHRQRLMDMLRETEEAIEPKV